MCCKHRLNRVSDRGEHHKQFFYGALLPFMKRRSGTPHKSKKEPSLVLRASVSVSPRLLLSSLHPLSRLSPHKKKESNQTGHMSVEISMTTLVKMHPCDLILNKCNVPNLGLFINGVARKAFVAASEIKI